MTAPDRLATGTHPGAPAATQPILLTSQQAAELLQVSVETLHAWGVPYVPVGGESRKRPRRRYLRATLEAWAKAQEAT